MKLYQFSYSPFAAKVRAVLALKQLACELVEVPFMDRRELIAITGGSIMIPVLVDGDEVIGDSPRITAHLERYAPSLRPAPLTAMAVVFESWADQLLEDVAFRIAAPVIEERIAALNGGRQDAPAMFRFTKERKYGAGCLDRWRQETPQLRQQLLRLLAPLDESLRQQPFILGALPSLADAALYGQLYMIEAMIPQFVAALSPALHGWYARIDGVTAGAVTAAGPR